MHISGRENDLREMPGALFQTSDEKGDTGGDEVFRSANDLPASCHGDLSYIRWNASGADKKNLISMPQRDLFEHRGKACAERIYEFDTDIVSRS